MSNSNDCQTPTVGDTGTLIICQVTKEDGSALDLTNMASAVIKVGRVGTVGKTLTASVYGNPIDGLLSAETEEDTWDYPGRWFAKGKPTFPDGKSWTGDKTEYTVLAS